MEFSTDTPAQITRILVMELSVNTVYQATRLLGQRKAQREAQWIENSHDPAYLQAPERNSERPDQVYGSVDGAFVPVGSNWKDQKRVSSIVPAALRR